MKILRAISALVLPGFATDIIANDKIKKHTRYKGKTINSFLVRDLTTAFIILCRSVLSSIQVIHRMKLTTPLLLAALSWLADAAVSGFDISHYQPNVNYAGAYGAGARFVIIKVCSATTLTRNCSNPH